MSTIYILQIEILIHILHTTIYDGYIILIQNTIAQGNPSPKMKQTSYIIIIHSIETETNYTNYTKERSNTPTIPHSLTQQNINHIDIIPIQSINYIRSTGTS